MSVLLLTVLMLMGFATFCMAAGGGTPITSPSGATPRFGNIYVIGWTAVNFFLLLALLYKFGFGPVNNILEERTTTIESSLKHAEDVRVEVDQMRQEAHANLTDSRKEAQEIVVRASKAAEDAKTAIISQAKEEATKVKSKAVAEIESATEQAKVEIQDTAVSLAIMAAEKLLNRVITEDDHRQMVSEFVNEAGDLLC
ncbi:MAG TPA: F0F1 ATP synthase subunit B [Syntrophomonadaceae bacterium]|nr:F0F1 ATP synthase subunit B [Syntrophomonadaceae bacterium]